VKHLVRTEIPGDAALSDATIDLVELYIAYVFSSSIY